MNQDMREFLPDFETGGEAPNTRSWAGQVSKSIKLSGSVAKIVVDELGNCDLIYIREADGEDRNVLSPSDVGRLVAHLHAHKVVVPGLDDTGKRQEVR
jgi:hypothetical protein